MSQDQDFRNLLHRVRQGEQSAMTQLVEEYGPALRVAVRVRLGDAALRQLVDSPDVCQSVLINFFVRVTAGQFQLDSPQQLLRLLQTMARNHVTNLARRHQADRRDHRRLRDHLAAASEVADPGPGPGEIVMRQELIDEVRRRLSPEEQWLAEQRVQGRSWEEIAVEKGESPAALRMRLGRAIDRITRALRLEN